MKISQMRKNDFVPAGTSKWKQSATDAAAATLNLCHTSGITCQHFNNNVCSYTMTQYVDCTGDAKIETG
jgi:hypothetical protein